MAKDKKETKDKKDMEGGIAWSIYITDQEVVDTVNSLCDKLSMSRNKVVEKILKRYSAPLLKNNKELMSVITA